MMCECDSPIKQPWDEYEDIPSWWWKHVKEIEETGVTLVVAELQGVQCFPSGGHYIEKVVYRDFRTNQIMGTWTEESKYSLDTEKCLILLLR